MESVEFCIEYNGEKMIATIPLEQYSQLINDANKTEKFAKELYCSIYGEVEQENDGVEVLELEKAIINNNNDTFIWTDESIRLLLQLRFDMEERFKKPKTKKKYLWNDIAKEMQKKGQYKVDGSTCDNKFRTLLTTYRKIKDRKKTSGGGAVTWKFFDEIDIHLGETAAVTPPPGTIGSSLGASSDTDSDIDLKELQQVHNNKRKKMESLSSILKSKIAADEKKYKEIEEAKKMRWQEKKQIEDRKVEALQELRNVFTNISEVMKHK